MNFRGCEALQGVDLNIESGSVFSLLGENGAGKTTLIRILTGFQRPSSGTVRVLGLDPITDALEIRRRIGYVSDSPALYEWMRVDEIGWFASSFYPDGFLKNYRDMLAQYDLPTNRKIKHLSKGQRAKVALALAVAHDPELLILDEPTSGLDPLVRRDFLGKHGPTRGVRKNGSVVQPPNERGRAGDGSIGDHSPRESRFAGNVVRVA